MSKPRLHHWLVIIRHLKVWQLIVLLVIFALTSAFLLRQNNLTMVQLRSDVKQADQENKDIKKSLIVLQHYVGDHMNTDLGGGITLQYSYQRAYDKAAQAAVKATNPNSKFYEQVEIACRPVFARTNSFPAYTECARQKLSVLAPGQDALSNFTAPPTDAYRYNFVSPLWSPDPAGLMVLATVLVGLTLTLRIVSYIALRTIVKRHHH